MDATLLKEAHADVTTALVIDGRQVPEALTHQAAVLLADLWETSLRHGVEPADWASTSARLPKVCVDVIVAVQRRPRIDPNGG